MQRFNDFRSNLRKAAGFSRSASSALALAATLTPRYSPIMKIQIGAVLAFGAGIILALDHTSTSAGPPTYKCQIGKRIEYSDNPCVGATVVDTTPTRGMDKLSGKTAKGVAVQKEELNEAIANAMRPLTGQTPQQREAAIRRVYLRPDVKMECASLDHEIPNREGAELSATGRDKAESSIALYRSRQRFKDLKC